MSGLERMAVPGILMDEREGGFAKVELGCALRRVV